MDSSCDLCGADDAAEIGIARVYTGDQPLHVCKGEQGRCGLVYVRERRSSAEIAADWDSRPGDSVYAASLAAVEARQMFVARFAQHYLGDSVCDVGAGDGRFLSLITRTFAAVRVFGISPSIDECRDMDQADIPHFHGLAEDYDGEEFDCATLLWTLENTGSCRTSIRAARRMAKYVIVATGSRLFVPFKKPLASYLGDSPADLHAWRFSHRTLAALMKANAIKPVLTNRYIDSDYLVVVGERVDEPLPWTGDDYRDVLKFFRNWHWATKDYHV